jgi:hypothetical protein
MNQWEKEFTIIKLLVIAIYGAVVIYAILVYFRIPDIPYIWEQIQKIVFIALLAAVVPMFLAAGFVGNQLMGKEKLTEKFNAAGGEDIGLIAAIANVRIGAVIMAAMGEACAVYGLVLYMLSGNHTYPFVFFAFSILHYPLTMSRLNKAQENINQLSKSY